MAKELEGDNGQQIKSTFSIASGTNKSQCSFGVDIEERARMECCKPGYLLTEAEGSLEERN